jgi:hypothetical protein
MVCQILLLCSSRADSPRTSLQPMSQSLGRPGPLVQPTESLLPPLARQQPAALNTRYRLSQRHIDHLRGLMSHAVRPGDQQRIAPLHPWVLVRMRHLAMEEEVAGVDTSQVTGTFTGLDPSWIMRGGIGDCCFRHLVRMAEGGVPLSSSKERKEVRADRILC